MNADTASNDRVTILVFDCVSYNDPVSETIDVDFGDAPAPYPTLLSDLAALHTIQPGIGLGPVVPLWISLGFADWMVKLSLALLALVPFRIIVGKLSPSTT